MDLKLILRKFNHALLNRENCEGAPTKAIRAYHNRLDILPLSCESASTNWVFITKGKNEKQQILFVSYELIVNCC